MQPRVTLSFRLIGTAACLLVGTLGCAAFHDRYRTLAANAALKAAIGGGSS